MILGIAHPWALGLLIEFVVAIIASQYAYCESDDAFDFVKTWAGIFLVMNVILACAAGLAVFAFWAVGLDVTSQGFN